MNNLLEIFQEQARPLQKNIIFPETGDERILQAAATLLKQELTAVTLVGEAPELLAQASKLNISLERACFVSYKNGDYSSLENTLVANRKHKGLTKDQAVATIAQNPLLFAALYVDAGLADGMVSGSASPTRETIIAALHGIGLAPECQLLSSFFMMVDPKGQFGHRGTLFFADCAVNIQPNATQLAEIALSTIGSFMCFFPQVPAKAALLSFSSKGSAEAASVRTIQVALDLVRKSKPDYRIDGELQFDAAVIPHVATQKAPQSLVAGQANILIFPDLNAGNIAYKIAQRFGDFQAIGPIFQGTNKPINDLSRGCSIEDIVNVSVITALQAV